MPGLGTITIPGSHWVWPAGILLLAAGVLMVWAYRRAPQIGPARAIAFGLKLLGLLALAWCLIEPLWSGQQAKSGANLFVVVADNSSGMNIRDRGSEQSRAEILQATLQSGTSEWLASLSEDFQLRQYLFDSRLRRTTDFSELVFDGTATDMGTALQTLGKRYECRPLAGVLLMTDGNATDMGEQSSDLSGLPPVYPVLMGRARPPRDIAVTNVSVSQTSFEDAPVTIQAKVEATGCAGQTVSIDLMEDSGHLVERQQWSVRQGDAEHVVRFRVRPERTGVLFYQVRVAEMSQKTPPSKIDSDAEATLANNVRTLAVDRGRGPYRILYVTGRPNWEYKFLQRSISEDEQVHLVGLIRVAKREPKYDWRGRAGEQSNPLYRGFEPTEEDEAEQYDQPVLVRLNTRDERELRDGFPTTREELFEYHAVVLDDVEAEFFTHDQMDLLRRFVTERGGGFLMLGGRESFRQGNLQHTPIAGILPVYLDRLPADRLTLQMRLHLTREGWLQPWTRLRDNEDEERQRLAEMPEFRVLNRIRAAKPGARVVATLGDEEGQQFPALIVQRLGNGRTAALTIGDVWRWGLRDPETHDDMDKFWRQTLRWLIADVPDRISLLAKHRPDEIGRPTKLQVRAHNKCFEPLDNVSVSIKVREPGGESVQLTAEPVMTESGLFETSYVPRRSGGYVAQATVTDANGTELDQATAGWAVDLEALEFQSVKTNRPLLERIARQTGGRLVETDQLDHFARSLPHQEVPITEAWTRPLWDLPGVLPALFVFVATCFIAEWALRRRKGMP
ncbi:MAG: hypothetical protein JSW27_14115 [Phycisphaerales bacterium]|nr:MAG: hypothetical protein JSW27_14115 [Phycisphaerales bacterium]